MTRAIVFRKPKRARKYSGWWILVAPALMLVAIGAGYPIATNVWRSVADKDGGQNAYVWVFSNSVYSEILFRTFATAVLTTAVCLILAYPFAYLMTIVGKRTLVVLLAVAILPFWVSILVRTFAWLVLLQPNGLVGKIVPFGWADGILGSWLAVEIGIAQVLLPFMILSLYSVMRNIDRKLIRAAESLGANPRTAFMRVFVPLSMPGVSAGCLFVFILTLGFYIVPEVLGSPKQALVGQTIYTQITQLLYWGRGGALATILLVATVASLGVVLLASAKFGKRPSS